MSAVLYYADASGERLAAPTADSRTYTFEPFGDGLSVVQLVEYRGATRLPKGALLSQDYQGWSLRVFDVAMLTVVGTREFASYDEAVSDTLRLAAIAVLDLAE